MNIQYLVLSAINKDGFVGVDVALYYELKDVELKKDAKYEIDVIDDEKTPLGVFIDDSLTVDQAVSAIADLQLYLNTGLPWPQEFLKNPL